MSALDMVLQRQVPARAAAKTGEGVSSADAGGDAGKDTFSAVLKGEKRNAAAGRERIDPADEAGAKPDPDAADAEIEAQSASQQSDEMLALLAGLMSSAAYTDEAEADTGSVETAELPDAELSEAIEAETISTVAMPMRKDAAAAETEADLLSAANANGEVKAKPEGDKAGQLKLVAATQAAANASGEAKAKPEGDKAGQLKLVAATQAQRQSAETGPLAAASAAAGSSAIAGGAGQLAQAAAKSKSSDTDPDSRNGLTEAKEAVRVLGSAEKEATAGSGSGKATSDDRFSGGAGRSRVDADRADKDQIGSRAGNVEVVESRRFMPPQPLSGNAQLLTRSLMESADAALAAQKAAPAQSAAATAQPQSGQMLHTLKLQLNPASLGSVTAVLKLTGEELSVAIQVETAEAYRQLNDDNQSILKALRAQGYGVEQITVQHVASTSDRSASQTPQQGFQGGAQGDASGDAQSSSSRENGGNSAGQQGTNQHAGQGHEHTPYPGSGSARSDGVYL